MWCDTPAKWRGKFTVFFEVRETFVIKKPFIIFIGACHAYYYVTKANMHSAMTHEQRAYAYNTRSRCTMAVLSEMLCTNEEWTESRVMGTEHKHPTRRPCNMQFALCAVVASQTDDTQWLVEALCGTQGKSCHLRRLHHDHFCAFSLFLSVSGLLWYEHVFVSHSLRERLKEKKTIGNTINVRVENSYLLYRLQWRWCRRRWLAERWCHFQQILAVIWLWKLHALPFLRDLLRF